MNREENDQGTMMQLFDLVSKLIATVPQNKTFRDDPKRSIKQTFMFLDICTKFTVHSPIPSFES